MYEVYAFAAYKVSGGMQRGRVVRAPDFQSGAGRFNSRSNHLAGVVSRLDPSSTPRSL